MAINKQKIDITLQYHVKNQERIMRAAKQQQAAHDKMRTGVNKASTQIAKNQQMMEIAAYGPGKVMRMNAKDLGKFNEIGGKFNTVGGKMANKFRMMTHGARGFRMEMLGVMFFGMALQRVFSGLIKTSLDWFGVTELLSMTLGLLFLPVGELVLGWALKFLDFVLQLTDTEKKVIGWFVLVGIAVGTLTFLIGTLALGIGSMILAFNFSKVATIIGSSGLGGISTAATVAATKVGGLGVMLMSLAKYAGIGIAIFMTVKDLKEGQLTAAIGMATLAVGLYTGNPYLIGIGVILKLIGDKEFLSDIIAVGLKVIDFFLKVGEEIGKILMAAITPGKKYEASSSFREAIIKGVGKADVQSQVLKDIGLSLPGATPGSFIPTLGESEKYLQSKGMGDIFVTQTNNVTGVSSPQDIKNMLEENNRALTADVARMVGG